jgi:hypothetical protein
MPQMSDFRVYLPLWSKSRTIGYRLLTRTDLVTRDFESFVSKTRLLILPIGTVCKSTHLNSISREREIASRNGELT